MKRVAANESAINHFGAIRFRVNGSGNLRLRLLSLDEVRTFTLVPLIMANPTNIDPTRLSNFTEQRAQLEIKTTAIDETFNISRIVIFSKPVASSYPA